MNDIFLRISSGDTEANSKSVLALLYSVCSEVLMTSGCIFTTGEIIVAEKNINSRTRFSAPPL